MVAYTKPQQRKIEGRKVVKLMELNGWHSACALEYL